jgi:DNA (cytosine-5)-methyltransferase 1
MVKEPTVISTFAGCGGSSLGYKWAGFRELLAIDFDDNAVETFKLNFPDVLCWKRDIREVTGAEIMAACHIKPGELDVLDGSPPCQGFSTAGKRQVLDPRNDLFREYVRLIKELQPKVFVMENVSGMVKGTMRGRFIEIMKELKSTGYNVRAKLMNAKWYEVPQSRERIIFIGVKDGEPSFPKPMGKIISVREALGLDSVMATRSQKINPWMDQRGGAATICKMSAGYEVLINTDSELKESALRPTWQSYRVLNGQEKRKHFSLVQVKGGGPSPTITKDAGNTSTGMIHPYEIRELTIAEIKRLSSFPDDFQLIGSFHEKWARIGNAVMPRFMYHIAKNIKENILSLRVKGRLKRAAEATVHGRGVAVVASMTATRHRIPRKICPFNRGFVHSFLYLLRVLYFRSRHKSRQFFQNQLLRGFSRHQKQPFSLGQNGHLGAFWGRFSSTFGGIDTRLAKITTFWFNFIGYAVNRCIKLGYDIRRIALEGRSPLPAWESRGAL